MNSPDPQPDPVAPEGRSECDAGELRRDVDRCCEAASKGDNPDAVGAYLWSNIAPLLSTIESVKAERDRSDRALVQVEKLLTDYGVAITYPLADAVLDVLVERQAAERKYEALREALKLIVETDVPAGSGDLCDDIVRFARAALSEAQEVEG